MNVRSVLIAHAIIIKGKKAATARNARRMHPDIIIRRKTENSVLTVRAITTVRKAKAATARNVLRTRPDIIRKRTANNALTVRAITTVRRVKAAIVRHARTTPINRRLVGVRKGGVHVQPITIRMPNTARRNRWNTRRCWLTRTNRFV